MNTLSVVESIFIAALEKENPDARAAYLAEACNGDAELRRCVERLLNAHARADNIIPTQAPGLSDTSEPPLIEERPGSIVGSYKLLQQLGEGGFGVVFMAEQEQPIRRKVALKIIKPGMDSKQVVARFEAERQALALMDHPNIARVLDGGTTQSGRPYFVMELVKGTPITEFCDQNRLTPRERLELFIPVCQAVQHAHQKGIIHRDIKPSNVLVTMYDDKPVPKVIDFGVAKAIEQKLTEQTLFTKVGQVIGTLEYMSPEQASLNALDVDTRSDVYALGVLLYELLTGSTPLNKEQLEGVAFMEMLRLIREVEPPRPSTRLSEMKGGLPLMAAYRKIDAQKLPKLVAGELDWIAMKALDKDRSRRYETASALATDVRRYLSEQPVEARPPSAWYRFRKMTRRNRAAVTATALVAAALVLGTVVAWLFALEAVRNAELADKHADLARKNEKIAEDEAEKKRIINEELKASQEDMRHALYANSMQFVQGAWRSNDVGRALDLLKKCIPAPGQKDLRHFEWHYWGRQIHGAKEVIELKGGQPKVHAEFSPDCSLLASLGMDGDKVVVRLWNTKTGKPALDLKGPALGPTPPGKIRAPNPVVGRFAFSADGRWLAAILRMPIVSVGDPIGGGIIKEFKEELIDLLPKQPPLELWLWDTESGTKMWDKVLPDWKWTVVNHPFFRFDAAGEKIGILVEGSAKGSGVIHVLARKDGGKLLNFSVPEQAGKEGFTTRLLSLSPDWKKLLMSQYLKENPSDKELPGALLLWDVNENKLLWQVPSPNDSGGSPFTKFGGPLGQTAAFSPDGERLFVQELFLKPGAKSEIRVRVYDAASGKMLCHCEVDSDTGKFQFSPDSKALVTKTRGPGGPILVWDTATGKLRHTVLIPDDRVWDVAFSAGGDDLYIAAGKTVQVWPAGRPALLRVSADGKAVQVWPAGSPKPISTSADPAYLLFYPSLSADGRRLALVTWPPTGDDKEKHKRSAILVLDTATGEELLAIKTLRAPVNKLVLSADGKHVVAYLRAFSEELPGKLKHEIIVWNVKDRKEVASYPLSSTSAAVMAFAGDGRLVALAYPPGDNERVLKVWKLPDGKDLANPKEIFEGTYTGSGLDGAHFSPDGRLLFFATSEQKGAKGSPNKWVPHILDVQSGQELSSPPALHLKTGGMSSGGGKPSGGAMGALVSIHGNLLAWYDGPGGLDSGTNKSHDIVVADLDPKGKKNLRLMGHAMPVISMAFSPDGKRLASLARPYNSGPKSAPNSYDIKIWDLHNGQDVLTLTTEVRDGALQFSADGHRLFFVSRSPNGPQSGMKWCEVYTWDATPLPGKSP